MCSNLQPVRWHLLYFRFPHYESPNIPGKARPCIVAGMYMDHNTIYLEMVYGTGQGGGSKNKPLPKYCIDVSPNMSCSLNSLPEETRFYFNRAIARPYDPTWFDFTKGKNNTPCICVLPSNIVTTSKLLIDKVKSDGKWGGIQLK